MRMFSCACVALIVLAPLPARAEMYESIKACTVSGVMRLGCFVIQKGVEVYIEKAVTEWYTAWHDADKPKPGSNLDSVAEDYRRRLSERAAAGRKGEQQLRGDLVDFNTLMLDVDAKVGPDRHISNATLATKFTQRCRTGDASMCSLIGRATECLAKSVKEWCVGTNGCEWANGSCRDVGLRLRAGAPKGEPAK